MEWDPQALQVSAPALLRKSVLSGQGLARCRRVHGRRLWDLSRWKPARTLTARTAANSP
ncbi:hypothetical protein [Streptomyces sp. NPDC005507]|uniref:hypothetical protein n=1 Tax=Streptomyces sp. NPDC005507 TaxID=3154885 RepID=UPI0033B0B689